MTNEVHIPQLLDFIDRMQETLVGLADDLQDVRRALETLHNNSKVQPPSLIELASRVNKLERAVMVNQTTLKTSLDCCGTEKGKISIETLKKIS